MTMADAADPGRGDEPAVRVERDGRVATVVIDRPRSLNAVSPEVLEALASAFSGLAADPGDLAGVLLVGEGGRAFVAGADLRVLSGLARRRRARRPHGSAMPQRRRSRACRCP